MQPAGRMRWLTRLLASKPKLMLAPGASRAPVKTTASPLWLLPAFQDRTSHTPSPGANRTVAVQTYGSSVRLVILTVALKPVAQLSATV